MAGDEWFLPFFDLRHTLKHPSLAKEQICTVLSQSLTKDEIQSIIVSGIKQYCNDTRNGHVINKLNRGFVKNELSYQHLDILQKKQQFEAEEKLSQQLTTKPQKWSFIAANTITKREQMIQQGTFDYYFNQVFNIESVACNIFSYLNLLSVIECGLVNICWMHYSYKPTSTAYIDTNEIGCDQLFWCKKRCTWIKKIILRAQSRHYYSKFKEFAMLALCENKIEEMVIVESGKEYCYLDEELICDIIVKNTNSLKKLIVNRHGKSNCQIMDTICLLKFENLTTLAFSNYSRLKSFPKFGLKFRENSDFAIGTSLKRLEITKTHLYNSFLIDLLELEDNLHVLSNLEFLRWDDNRMWQERDQFSINISHKDIAAESAIRMDLLSRVIMNLKNVKELHVGWMLGEYYTHCGNVSPIYFLSLFCEKLKENILESLTLAVDSHCYNLAHKDEKKCMNELKKRNKKWNMISRLTKLDSVCFKFAKRYGVNERTFSRLKELFFEIFSEMVSVKIRRGKGVNLNNYNGDNGKETQNATTTKRVHKCGLKKLKFDFGLPMSSYHVINGEFRQFLLNQVFFTQLTYFAINSDITVYTFKQLAELLRFMVYFRGKINKENQNNKNKNDNQNRLVTKMSIVFEDRKKNRKSNKYGMRHGGHQWIDILKKWYQKGNNSCIDLSFQNNTMNTNSNWFKNFVAYFTRMLGSNCVVNNEQNGVNSKQSITIHCWISDTKSQSRLEIYCKEHE